MRSGALLLAVLATASALIVWRTQATDPQVSGDTFWYARQAARFAGATDHAAIVDAAGFMTDQRGGDPAYWLDLVDTIDRRYPAIFEARPLYPLSAAPLVPLTGLDALLVVSAIAGLVTAGLVALGALHIWSSAIAGFVAGIAAVALPAGDWFAFAYADGAMLAAWAATLLLAGHHLQHGGRTSAAGFGVAMLATILAKSANGFVLALAIIVVAAVLLVRRSDARGRAVVLAGVASVIGASFLVISSLLGLSGIGESLQDLATHHFRDPDVADPVGALLRRDGHLLAAAPGMIGDAAVPITVALVGLTILLLRPSAVALLWTVAAAGCLLLVLLHPLPSEIPRLLAPVWLSVAIGLGALAASALIRARKGPRLYSRRPTAVSRT